MIRWDGPLTYEKTQSTILDVLFGEPERNGIPRR